MVKKEIFEGPTWLLRILHLARDTRPSKTNKHEKLGRDKLDMYKAIFELQNQSCTSLEPGKTVNRNRFKASGRVGYGMVRNQQGKD